MNTLPNELLLKVLAYTPVPDLINFSWTCKNARVLFLHNQDYIYNEKISLEYPRHTFRETRYRPQELYKFLLGHCCVVCNEPSKKSHPFFNGTIVCGVCQKEDDNYKIIPLSKAKGIGLTKKELGTLNCVKSGCVTKFLLSDVINLVLKKYKSEINWIRCMAKACQTRYQKRLAVDSRKIQVFRIAKFLQITFEPFLLNKYTNNGYSKFIRYGSYPIKQLVKAMLQLHFITRFSSFDPFRVPFHDFDKCVYYTLIELEPTVPEARGYLAKHDEILQVDKASTRQDTPEHRRRLQIIDLLKTKYNTYFVRWPSISVFQSEIFEYILHNKLDAETAIESDILDSFLRSRTLYEICHYGATVESLDTLKRQSIRLYLQHGHVVPDYIKEIAEKRGLMPEM